MPADRLDRLPAVGAFGDDLHRVRLLESRDDPAPPERLVVHDDGAQWHSFRRLPGTYGECPAGFRQGSDRGRETAVLAATELERRVRAVQLGKSLPDVRETDARPRRGLRGPSSPGRRRARKASGSRRPAPLRSPPSRRPRAARCRGARRSRRGAAGSAAARAPTRPPARPRSRPSAARRNAPPRSRGTGRRSRSLRRAGSRGCPCARASRAGSRTAARACGLHRPTGPRRRASRRR